MNLLSNMPALRTAQRRRLFKIAAAALLSTSHVSLAMAQTGMPTVDTVDENGVDLFSLNVSPPKVGDEISIGTGDFPARLNVSGEAPNLNITLGDNSSTTRILSESFRISMTIGRIRRVFNSNGTTGTDGIKFNPADGRGGYILKTVEGSTTVYTYYSSAGDTLRFLVSEGAACARSPAFATGTTYMTCARVSSWTAANGVRADFTYIARSDALGYSNESDLTSVTNTLGLSLAFSYTQYKDNGHHTSPTYGVTTIVASSNQLGTCTGQASCSRTATYQYTPLTVAPVNIDNIDQTQIKRTQYTDALGNTTQYVGSGSHTFGTASQSSIRFPAHPTVDARTVVVPAAWTPASGPVILRDSFGNEWNYTRAVLGGNFVKTTRTDPQSHTRVYDFDPQGNLYRFQDELAQVTLLEHNGVGELTKITSPNGVSTSSSYDGRGNVVSTTTKAVPAGSAPDIVTSATFAPDCTSANLKTCNKPLTTTDALNHTTTYTYDNAHGGVLTVTGPQPTTGAAAPQTRYTYGLISGAYAPATTSSCRTTTSCTGTADETKVTLGYGANGLLPTTTTVQSGDGAIQSTVSDSYDAFGNVVSEDGPLSGTADTTYARYDRKGNLIGTVKPDPDGAGPLVRAASRTSYDADGNMAKVESGTVAGVTDTDWTAFSAKQALTTTYDTNDRKTADVVGANGTTYATTQYSYDTLGRLDCTAVRMNSAVWASLPPSACTAQTAGSVGADRIAKLTYDYAGHTTKVTAAYGTPRQIDQVTATYVNNQVTTEADANSNVTTYGYDGYGRVQSSTYPGGSYTQRSLDANGNVASLRLRDGTSIAFTRDNLDRVTTKTPPTGETATTYTYDLAGHVLTTTQGTAALTSDWDALGRQKSETQPFGSLAYQYDPAGNRVRASWQDGFYTTYSYDNANQLTAIKENGSAALASFTYDDLGRRTALTRGNGVTTSYSFDPASRLSGMTSDFAGTANDQSVTFTYNPAGQILTATRANIGFAFTDFAANVSRPYTVNALNQYTSSNSIALGYDTRGNLTSSGATTYAYTSENLLKGFSGGVTLSYDPQGRLVQYDVGGTTRMMYDGGEIAAELSNTSGTIAKRYIFGPGMDEPLVEYDASGTKTYLVGDERGSIMARTDAAGAITRINTFDEYGIPGANNLGRFQYTGQAWFNELGLSYYKARIYSPSLGRFMQTDPAGYADGMNWYSYAANDPINGSDPSGLSACYSSDCMFDIFAATYPGQNSKGPSLPAGNWGPGYGNFFGVRNDFSGYSALLALAPSYPFPTTDPLLDDQTLDDISKESCVVGNTIVDWSDKTGKAGLVTSSLGATLFLGSRFAGPFAPEVMGLGASVLATGGVLGQFSAGLQTVGGVFQGVRRGNFHNTVAGVANFLIGGLTSRAARWAFSSKGPVWAREAAQARGSAWGNIMGMASNAADWLAPSQVDCK